MKRPRSRAGSRRPGIRGCKARLQSCWDFFFLRRGDRERAMQWSDLAVERLPRDRDSAYNAIHSRFRNGAFADAADHAEAALQRCGEHVEFYSILRNCRG
jgi:hypothetical protein